MERKANTKALEARVLKVFRNCVREVRYRAGPHPEDSAVVDLSWVKP